MAAMGKRRCAAAPSIQSARVYDTKISLQEHQAGLSALCEFDRHLMLRPA